LQFLDRLFYSGAYTQAWFWEKEWQHTISKSIEDMKAGKFKVFKSVKETKKSFGD
jgi:hypothetical protein